MPNDELNEMISKFKPGELHKKLKAIGHDANTNQGKIEMALSLMQAGIPMNQIPIDNPKELIRMYEEHVLGITKDLTPQDQKILKKLLSNNHLDNKRYFKLSKSNKLEVISSSLDRERKKYRSKPQLDISYFSNQQNLPTDENSEDEEDLDLDDDNIITPKEINDLIDKLEAILDAAVVDDEFDPDLLPVAKKILNTILEKIQQIENSETIETTDIPENSQRVHYKIPQVANIALSMVKLSNIAEQSNNMKVINNIDFLIKGIYKMLKHK